jgi:RNase H-like domain found in reverse transcriptase/Integrase zinc binding domain
LIHPDFDKEFTLYIDACAIGVAGNLSQVSTDDGKEHPILYISRRLNSHEAKYTATELECLGMVWCLDKLAHYVDGSKLRLVTDHSALKWIWGIKSDVNARLFKWSLQLSLLKDKVTIVHCPGRFHQNVDPLSRNPSSYHITLIYLADTWKEKLWKGYQEDPYFKRIIQQLPHFQEHKSKGGDLPTASTTAGSTTTAGPTTVISTMEASDQQPSDHQPSPAPTSNNSDRPVEQSPESIADIADSASLSPSKDTITDGTFTLIDKTLYFSERRQGHLRLCIPAAILPLILKQNHDQIGHPGIRRTYMAIHLRYYFPKMSRKVEQHVNNCSICQTCKPSHEPPLGLLYPIKTEEPFHTLSLDFVTSLPLSTDGKDALLTVTDKFTKAVRLIPCTKTTDAEETAKLYLQYCYPIFGLPVKLISDRDSRFTSCFWTSLMHLLGVDHGMTAAFHPSADGQAEKTNQTIEIGLRCFLGGIVERYSKWTDYLPILEHEYNSLVQESTKLSPNELCFAVPLRGISDLATPGQVSSESAETLAEALKNARDDARDSLALAQRKQKKYTDAKRSPKEFQVGDLVLIKYRIQAFTGAQSQVRTYRNSSSSP